jgi:hypothetical protein
MLLPLELEGIVLHFFVGDELKCPVGDAKEGKGGAAPETTSTLGPSQGFKAIYGKSTTFKQRYTSQPRSAWDAYPKCSGMRAGRLRGW